MFSKQTAEVNAKTEVEPNPRDNPEQATPEKAKTKAKTDPSSLVRQVTLTKVADVPVANKTLDEEYETCSSLKEMAEEKFDHPLVDAGAMGVKLDDDATDATHKFFASPDNAFISAAVTAFSEHFPLAIHPGHVCLLILQAFARDVSKNSEALRSTLVTHQGKKALTVHADHFVLGEANDWASIVTSEGSNNLLAQIRTCLVDGVFERIVPELSDTTEIDRVISGIAVMETFQVYVSYGVSTCCGFPEIVMRGTLDDWVAVRTYGQSILGLCSDELREKWTGALMALLDKFVTEYTNALLHTQPPDGMFWNCMCKRGAARMSGQNDYYSGWLNILFPYRRLENTFNKYSFEPYSPTAVYTRGQDVNDFPDGLSVAPVDWNYHGTKISLSFHSGFLGIQQNTKDKVVSPVVGWGIVNPESPKKTSHEEW